MSRCLYVVAVDVWDSHVRARREGVGISQRDLARRVGVSRQALTAIEAGRQVPSTSLALALARALGCRVEDLFATEPDALDVRRVDRARGRVVLGRVRGRWVAHAADGVADAVLDGDVARPLDDAAALEGHALVAGCAPLLAVLADHVARRCRGEARVRWIHASSARALELLAEDAVHVAGVHLFEDDASGAELARARFGDDAVVVGLTRWRQGLLVAPGNPLGLVGVDDLARLDGRFARREVGSGATKLLTARLDASGLTLPDGPEARTHRDVARLVGWRVADAGMAIEAEALAAGLGFVPLTEERFDLVMRAEVAASSPVRRLLDVLTERGFRADVAALPGYDASIAGERVA